MEHTKKGQLPLNAVWLRLLALACMLLDHLWATVVPGNWWMTCVGRMAFPIFAFQVVEGYYHTSDLRRYMRRLLIFGLISEIPFNLMLGGFWLYPFHQNVMFTLLFGLLAVRSLENACQRPDTGGKLRSGLMLLDWLGLSAITLVDYGIHGVLMVLLFAVSRRVPFAKLFQLAGMVVINWFLMKGLQLQVWNWMLPVQGFAVLALVPIWLYNGEKGPRNQVIQYGSYLFYPAHMLILGLVGYYL